jgi:hypothetical protein
VHGTSEPQVLIGYRLAPLEHAIGCLRRHVTPLLRRHPQWPSLSGSPTRIWLGSGITITSVKIGNIGGNCELDTTLMLSNGGSIQVVGVSGYTYASCS